MPEKPVFSDAYFYYHSRQSSFVVVHHDRNMNAEASICISFLCIYVLRAPTSRTQRLSKKFKVFSYLVVPGNRVRCEPTFCTTSKLRFKVAHNKFLNHITSTLPLSWIFNNSFIKSLFSLHGERVALLANELLIYKLQIFVTVLTKF